MASNPQHVLSSTLDALSSHEIEDGWWDRITEAVKNRDRALAEDVLLEFHREKRCAELCWFIAWLLDDLNPIQKLWSAAKAFGLSVAKAKSYDDIADLVGANSRAVIRKHVCSIEEELGAKSDQLESEVYRESCRERAIKAHESDHS